MLPSWLSGLIAFFTTGIVKGQRNLSSDVIDGVNDFPIDKSSIILIPNQKNAYLNWLFKL